MPKIDYNLASQRLDTSGRSPGLRPVLIDAGAAASIHAPQINVNAANVEYTPTQGPRVGIADPLAEGLKGAGVFIQTWNEAAQKYQQRQDEMTASMAVEQVQEATEALLNGRMGEDGTFYKGYTSAKLADATEKHPQFMQELDAAQGAILNKLDPSARALAANKVIDIRRQAMNAAAKHRLGEESELGKRTYERDANYEVTQIGNELATLVNANAGLKTLDPETQAKILGPTFARINAEVNRRKSKLQDAPLNADPYNDTLSEVMQYLYTQDGGNLVAEAIDPHITAFMTSPEAIAKISKAADQYYTQSLNRIEYTSKVQAATEKANTAREHKTIYDFSTASVGDPVKEVEALNKAYEIGGTYAHNLAEAAMRAKKSTGVPNVDSLKYFKTARDQQYPMTKIFEDMANGLVSPTAQQLKDHELELTTGSGAAVKAWEDTVVKDFQAKLKDLAKQEEMSLDMDKYFKTPTAEQDAENVRQRAGAYLRDLKRQGLTAPEIDDKMTKWMGTEMLNAAQTTLSSLNGLVKAGPGMPNTPKSIQLYEYPEIQGKPNVDNPTQSLPGIKNVRTPIQGLRALSPMINEQTVPDENTRAAALQILKDPEAVEKLYLEARKSNTDIDFVNDLDDVFHYTYRALQRHLLDKNKVSKEVRTQTEMELGEAEMHFTHKFMNGPLQAPTESQIKTPAGGKK